MKTPLMQLKERIVAISGGEDEMIRTKDLLDAIDFYLMFEKGQAMTLQNQSESKVISELSDEEIKEFAYKYKENEYEDTWEAGISFMEGAKWYREQLKIRQ